MLAAAARHERRLLFASSSEVYGKLNQAGLGEDSDRLLGSPAKSRWSYAIAKEFGEALAHAYAQELGLEMIVARLFNTVGPRQPSSYGMVLPRFVHQALAGEPLTVYGDGTQTRCFTDVHDVVRALGQLVASDVARGQARSTSARDTPIRVVDLANRVIELTGSSPEMSSCRTAHAHSEGFEELGNRAPDTSALRALPGWTPRAPLEQTIDSVVAHELDRALVFVRERTALAVGSSLRRPDRVRLINRPGVSRSTASGPPGDAGNS